MINPLQMQSIGFTARRTIQNKPVQSTDKQSEQEKSKNNGYKYALYGMSLVALGTTAGMIYFARRNVRLNKDIFRGISEGNTSSTPRPKFYEQTTTPLPFNPNEGYKPPTVAKPKWEITSTRDVDASRRTPTTPVTRPVVTGILPSINKNLGEYLKTCEKGKINPEKVDEILTKAVGEQNVTERPFRTSRLHPRGRVKKYQAPDGKTYVLETHEVLSNNVTRVYIEGPKSEMHAYLFPDGTFRQNSFREKEAHFTTTSKGKRWMEKSRYLNNGAR